MAYPQTRADVEVLNGKNFWRLRTPLSSSGDIYELDTSAAIVAIGPNSDVERARITYYDVQAAASVNSVVISAGNPFIGRLDALLDTEFPTTGSAATTPETAESSVARVFISPLDSIQPDYIPLSQFPDDIFIYPPVDLDVLSFLSEPASIPGTRPDKKTESTVPVVTGSTNTTRIALPHYGRRSFTVNATAQGAGVGYTMDVDGITFFPAGFAGAPIFGETSVASAVALPAATGTQATVSGTAAAFGFFDLLQITISGPTTIPFSEPYLVVLQSDEAL